MSDPARFLPIVYDPTIGEACLKFGHIFRQPRGMYLSIARRGKVKEILQELAAEGRAGHLRHRRRPHPRPRRPWRERHGHPDRQAATLHRGGRRAAAVSAADVSRRRHQQRAIPARSAYLGLRKTRPPTAELYSFVDEFVEAVQEVFPKCCIHFEDWTGSDAVHLLQRYRDKYCVYNDDVQGTAGITLAGMINAAKLKGTKLKDEKYLFLGAGSAGIGLADLLCSALVARGHDAEGRRRRRSTCSTSTACWSRPARIWSTSRSRTPTSTRRPGTSSPPSRASSRPRSSASARSAALSRRRSSRRWRGSTNGR